VYAAHLPWIWHATSEEWLYLHREPTAPHPGWVYRHSAKSWFKLQN
jgi:hypothetical protein